ncbi:anti-sigma-K factor RskA [Granulicella aggregans]|uniref:Regulator of SigK n=1 Tax=Granulicella aggregans TaxID=474949 RepID=A0A7W7Z936_9BACT|nr:anti-sigma factor [Granulicella aggregans]MBB5055522.1 anti-sigma-K factor RskA [Granulicella aggregans]
MSVDNQNVNNHVEHDDLALYAMHFLTEQEAEAIESHLEVCAGCTDAIALLRGDLAALAVTAEMVAPPPPARQRLMTQVAREKKIIPFDRPVHQDLGSPLVDHISMDGEVAAQHTSAARVLPWVSWIGWAVAAGVTILATDLYRDRDQLRAAVAQQASEMASLSASSEKERAIMGALTDPDAMRVTLVRTPTKTTPVGRASYVAGKGALLFTASNLDPLEPLKTYELWIIPADGSSPVPAGTFVPDAHGDATVIMPEIPKGIIAKAFGITIEDQGGSLKPTPPIVLQGE